MRAAEQEECRDARRTRIHPDALRRMRDAWVDPDISVKAISLRFQLSTDTVKQLCGDLPKKTVVRR